MTANIELLGPVGRRAFIGGSDARVIMGDNEPALVRLSVARETGRGGAARLFD
jgi:hypothetical protein